MKETLKDTGIMAIIIIPLMLFLFTGPAIYAGLSNSKIIYGSIGGYTVSLLISFFIFYCSNNHKKINHGKKS